MMAMSKIMLEQEPGEIEMLLPFHVAGTLNARDARRVDDALLVDLSRLVRKQASPMRTTVTASNYRRQVAAALATRLVRELAGSSTRD